MSVPPRQDAQLILTFALGQTPEEARTIAASVDNLEPQGSLADALSAHQARWLTLDPELAGPTLLLAHLGWCPTRSSRRKQRRCAFPAWFAWPGAALLAALAHPEWQM
ncbi:MAG: hypothetical protein ACE5LU_11030 [Anaerolineae bacterium]